MRRFYLLTKFRGYYEEGGNNPPPPPTSPPPPPTPPAKTFTQDEVNAILSNERKALKEASIKQLEELQKSKGLTEAEKERLAVQVEELRNSMLTKEQQQEKETNKIKKQHQEAVTELTKDRDSWKGLFESTTIENEIMRVGSSQKVLNVAVLASVLKPMTSVEPVMNEDGTPTGKFAPKVKMNSVDKAGNPVVLSLTVEQAVAAMKDDTSFQFMFEDGSRGGLGGNNGGSKVKPITVADLKGLSPEEYRKKREQLLNQ